MIGLLSSIVDNVPLVAGAMGMYEISTYPSDHLFWELLAYCAGTGGSVLIIGSAAGVAIMGILKIDFHLVSEAYRILGASGLSIRGPDLLSIDYFHRVIGVWACICCEGCGRTRSRRTPSSFLSINLIQNEKDTSIYPIA